MFVFEFEFLIGSRYFFDVIGGAYVLFGYFFESEDFSAAWIVSFPEEFGDF